MRMPIMLVCACMSGTRTSRLRNVISRLLRPVRCHNHIGSGIGLSLGFELVRVRAWEVTCRLLYHRSRYVALQCRRGLFGEGCRSIIGVGDDGYLIRLRILKSLLVGVGACNLAVGWAVVYPLDTGLGDWRTGIRADWPRLSVCELILRV